jgi:hypothetical protein
MPVEDRLSEREKEMGRRAWRHPSSRSPDVIGFDAHGASTRRYVTHGECRQGVLLEPRHVLNWTAEPARATQTNDVSNENPGTLSNMKAGDVLVSHPTAVREHEISVIPNAPHAVSPTHDAAVNDGRAEARAMGVDAWLTEDHTHVVKIASHRVPDK